MASILLCDDEAPVARALKRMLRDHQVVLADGPDGLDHLKRQRFDVILTDLLMPGVDGFAILEAARRYAPTTPVIVMSGRAQTSEAVRAMRAGARDFLTKPFDLAAFEEVLASVWASASPSEAPATEALAWRDQHAPWLLGDSPAMKRLFTALSRVTDTDCTVLITGESGAGKELVARAIVAGSDRARQPFVAVNCAAFPSTLIDSELFGHKKGAFTGATASRSGRFVQAHQGTIFLDEIGEMEIGAQAKLLRLIQEGELTPVGADVSQKVDVRLLAATNRMLEQEIQDGRFRNDLFWRLNVFPVEVPSLRQRVEDIPALTEHFIRCSNERFRRSITGVSHDVMHTFRQHAWPGNIRELENLIVHMVIMKRTGQITLADLPPALMPFREPTAVEGASTTPASIASLSPESPSAARESASTMPESILSLPPEGLAAPIDGGNGLAGAPDLPDGGCDLRLYVDQINLKFLTQALDRSNGNKHRAAALLGLNRTTFLEKLRRLGRPPTER
jgi:DNA-binding NtrC family response regulator